MTAADHLGRCHFCGGPVFKLNLKTGPSGPTDVDCYPWCIEDETEPETNNGKKWTKPALQRWRDERPYRLGLVKIDLARGTYEAAAYKPRQKSSATMYKLHWCKEKDMVFYGVRR